MATAPSPSIVFVASTKQTTNYARLCRLLVDVGSQVLHSTFDKIHPPATLHTVLGTTSVHYATLKSLKKNRILNPTQWGSLYPHTPVSSATFDITLLTVLLRYICGLSPPANGWDCLPPATNISIADDIARVKYYRNTIYGHASQASVDDSSFSVYWQEIREALVRLGGAHFRSKIDNLEHACMDPDFEEHYRELTKQWKKDDDSIKEKVGEIEDSLEKMRHDFRDTTEKIEIEMKEVFSSLATIVEKNTDKGNFDPTELINGIRQLYKTREGWLSPFPWCEEFQFFLGNIFTKLKVVRRKKRSWEVANVIVDMSSILDPYEECSAPRTVLIEGEPGMGKTTYCKKYVYDWATGNRELQGYGSSAFKVVLLLKCRDIHSDLWDAIDDQILPRDVDEEVKQQFFQFILKNQSSILLILDGLDEVPSGKLTFFSELIKGRVLPRCHIVTTARHEAGKEVRKFCDVLLQIEGFTEAHLNAFVTKYFKGRRDLATKLSERISRDKNLREMAANPLNTALLCLLCEEFGGTLPENRAQLYFDMVECVLRRYRKKKGISEMSEDLTNLYKPELNGLGLVALNGLLNNKFDFNESELGNHAKELTKFGFLSVQPGGSKLRPNLHYAFLHKSFQEWFAAFFIRSQIHSKDITPEELVSDPNYFVNLKQVLDKTEMTKMDSKLKEVMEKVDALTTPMGEKMDEVPPEIRARGPQALEAYNNALAEGQACVKRVPLMIVGQDRSGKTSVKNSLKGICFNPDVGSTRGIEVDRYDFKVTTEIWKTGEKDEEANIDATVISYEYNTARWMAGKLKTHEKIAEVKKTSSAEPAGCDFEEIDSTKERESSETLSDATPQESFINPVSTNATDLEPNLSTKGVRNPTELEPEEDSLTTTLEKLPDFDDVAKVLSQFFRENREDDQEDVYSILWDFAGQSVYYVTHPLFLTRRAIYFLVYDLSRNPCFKATPLKKKGVYKPFTKDEYNLKTNFDYLDFWMSSLASLVSDCPLVSLKKFPAVFLVCTHADQPYCDRNPFELAHEIFGDLKSKPYGAHLFDVFCVDNTKSGTESECKEIMRLRAKVHVVSKELPHVIEPIPIKWLKYEKALRALKESDHKFISLSTAKKIAAKFCNINDHEVQTVLTFLHDLRVLIHFDDSPELNELVFLDIQWLIDVFKNVITVRAYDVGRDFAPLWEDLEKKGILNESLLKHVWNSLVPQRETHESLIAIMEKFSLMCPWPSSDDLCNKHYLVPSMLRTLPPKQISDLVDSSQLPSLFLKFDTGRVPPGLFPRLVLEFFQWCRKEFSGIDLRKTYRNFARFYNFPNQGLSLVLICHSSTIEVVVLSVKSAIDEVDIDSIRAFRNQLTSIIDRVWKKFFWVKNVGCEVSFLCPVCSYRRMVSFCPQHDKDSCEQEDCLHFISESDLKDEKEAVCTYSETTLDNSIYVEQFAPWISSGKEKGLSSSDVTARSHGEASEINPMKSATELRVTLLGSEWSSSMGGLSTINRQLAIQLAKHSEVEVTLLVPQSACSEEEKRMASRHNVSIREAKKLVGYSDCLEWLISPPGDLVIDFVLGHGAKLGKQAQVIRRSRRCKWIQVVHTAPEELAMYKDYPKAITKGDEKNSTEVELCKSADVVLAVGPKLRDTFSAQLRSCKSQDDILQLTPGTFCEFYDSKQEEEEHKKFYVLTFGRGDLEDFSLKGYDISARAIVELKDRSYRLIFVGAPDGKQDEVAAKLRDSKIDESQLVVRKFVQSQERLKELFSEVDLCIMPSRAEGFGLTALEALSAGLPILVSGNSGFGEALCTLPLGKSFVVESEDPREWAKAIAGVRQKERSDRLQGIKQLKISYEEKFSWEKQCDILVEKMRDIVEGSQGRIIQELQQMQLDASKVKSRTDLSLGLRNIASERGFRISDNEGLGNCMFYALSEQLEIVKGIKIPHGELRQNLVQYLRSNPKLPDGTDLFHFVHGHQTWTEYLVHMEQDGGWGDHVILCAAANYFRMCIRVVSSLSNSNDVIITPHCPVDESKPLVLGHIHEVHYVSLQPVQG